MSFGRLPQARPVAAPYSQQAATLGLDRSQATRAWQQQDKKTLSEHTPYGPMEKSIKVQDTIVKYICPMALLFASCAGSDTWAIFLTSVLLNKVGRFILYLDDVTPGNALRPDHGRKYYALYWSLIEFPSWLRSRKIAWAPLCFVSLSTLGGIDSGISVVCALLLEQIWSDDAWNLETLGVRVPCCDQLKHLRIKFGCILADEKAIKEVCCGKGASGKKPCLCCANIFGREDGSAVAADNWAQPYTCGDVAKFDKFTHARFKTMLEEVRSAWLGNGTQSSKKEVERLCGVSFNRGLGLLWRRSVDITNMPEGIYYDWMHNLVASGGIAQYEVNQFLLLVLNSRVSLEDLAQFQKTVHYPKSYNSIRSLDLAARLVNQPGAHIKAFAQEVLSLVPMMIFFAEMVLMPLGVLPEHTLCLRYLNDILHILRHGDGAVAFVNTLGNLVRQHHELYMALYPACAKPKSHYLMHLPEQIQKFGANLSCFAGERMHRTSKKVGWSAFKNSASTIQTRVTMDWLRSTEEASSVALPRLGASNRRSRKNFLQFFSSHFGGDPSEIVVASDIEVEAGRFHNGDLVAMRCDGGQHYVARLLACARAAEKLVVAVERLAHLRGSQYASMREGLMLGLGQSIRHGFCYVQEGDDVYIQQPIFLSMQG